MIKFRFFQKHPSSHYVYIDMLIDHPGEQITVQLPSWRPGRYELGNFAKNIKRVEFFNERNELLKARKTSKDAWKVECKGAASVLMTYSYYSAEMNAGACYADEHQVYMNPVHCCPFVEGRTDEPQQITLEVPDHFTIASSLRTEGKILTAENYDELVDSPFIASAQIQSQTYESGGKKFYVHLNGVAKPDWTKILRDFKLFTDKQLAFWEEFPYDEYHFLFQVLPFRFYHGVEHKKNTVIAIGPGYSFDSGSTYEDVLGVSCHELFHVWNIKTIRPAEMQPYNYSKENYARTGYVYEGFTTYYGDKILYTSGVFNQKQYFSTLLERVQKHLHNFGRFNLSVADSSWDTWLDGYTPGVPYRKTSIYDEGNLVAFMLDVKIIEGSKGRHSLRDVCVALFERFGKTGKGYTESDVVNVVNEVAGVDLSLFFRNTVESAVDYMPELVVCAEKLGWKLSTAISAAPGEHWYGFRSADAGQFPKVHLVVPYSPAWKAGIFQNDDIIAVNGIVVRNNLQQWLSHFSADGKVELTVISSDRLKTVTLEKHPKGVTYFGEPVIEPIATPTESQKMLLKKWMEN